MMRYLVYLGACGLGVLFGIVLTWLSLAGAGGQVRNGIWSTDLTIGSQAAGPYTRAAIALNGLLALARSEAVYFFAETDADGRPLTGACQYTLAGRDPDARWWSVTVYGPDGFLVPNAGNRFSVSSAEVARQRDGRFRVALDADGRDGALPTGPGPFNLVLRLYNPGRDVLGAPESATLPTLTRGACRS